MAIIFQDNFNRANSATVGNGWVQETQSGTGTYSILNNHLRISAPGISDVTWLYNPATGYYKGVGIKITFTMTTTTLNTQNYIVASARHTAGAGGNINCRGLLMKCQTGGNQMSTVDTSGSYGSNVTTASWVAGYTYYVEMLYLANNAFEGRVWRNTDSRPVTAQATIAAGTPLANGLNFQFGVDNGNNAGGPVVDITDYVVEDYPPIASGTTYRVRAYATNSAGTSYGSTVSVTTFSENASSPLPTSYNL